MYVIKCVPLLIVENMLYKAYRVFLQIPFYFIFFYYSTPFFFLFAVSATHKETKQFFTLYNTLDDKKVYLEKEVRKCYYYFLSIQSVEKQMKSFCLVFTIFSPVRADLLVCKQKWNN